MQTEIIIRYWKWLFLVENTYSLNDLRYNLFITNTRKMNKEITAIKEIDYFDNRHSHISCHFIEVLR